MMDVEKTKLTKSDLVFNGLGGHSKLDDSFPVPKRPSTIGFKRYKSGGKISSGKVKKVAPLPTTNKGLDNFISLLSEDE